MPATRGTCLGDVAQHRKQSLSRRDDLAQVPSQGRMQRSRRLGETCWDPARSQRERAIQPANTQNRTAPNHPTSQHHHNTRNTPTNTNQHPTQHTPVPKPKIQDPTADTPTPDIATHLALLHPLTKGAYHPGAWPRVARLRQRWRPFHTPRARGAPMVDQQTAYPRHTRHGWSSEVPLPSETRLDGAN